MLRTGQIDVFYYRSRNTHRRCRLRFYFAAALATLFFASAIVSAQDSGDVIRVDTELVSFEITATDKNGEPVRELRPEDIRILEDGVERRPDFFQPIRKYDKGRPLSVVFALDVSGSMTTEELDRLRSAMRTFVARLADYNSYFAIVSFAMDVKVVQGFTNRPDKLERSFRELYRDQKGLSTHAYDAIDDSIRLLVKKSPVRSRESMPKRAIVVITDGFPVGDVVAPATVTERANNAETSIYAVVLPSYSRLQGSKHPILTPLEASGLMTKTGGKSLYATDRSYDPIFESLAEEIASSYAVAIYPTEEPQGDRRFHVVKIEGRNGIVVRQNRPGYTTGK